MSVRAPLKRVHQDIVFLRARRAHSRYRAVESEAGVEAEAGVESEAGTDKSNDIFKKHGRYARKHA